MLKELLDALHGYNKTGIAVDPSSNHHPVLVHDAMNLRSLEKYNLTRYRKRMNFKTSVLDSFCAYLKSNATGDGPIVTVDNQSMSSAAIFNHANNGHCDDVAHCKLEQLPFYTILNSIHENNTDAVLTQEQMIDWLNDWKHHIINFSETRTPLSKLTVNSVKLLESEVGDWDREKTIMEKSEIKAGFVKPPEHIKVSYRPYLGFQERELQLRLSATVKHDEIHIRLKPVGFEEAKLDIANEFAVLVRDGAGDGSQILLGTIRANS